LLAAFLVAFLFPLAFATNGRVFSHGVVAAFLVSLHAAVALRLLAPATALRRTVTAVGAALAALALLVAWEPAPYWIVAWAIPIALLDVERRTRLAFVVAHAAAVVAACAVVPSLTSTRTAGSWTTAAVLACVMVAWLPAHRRAGWRGAGLVAGTTALLTILFAPLRAGATEQFPALAYVGARARHLFGRPESAADLSDWVRHLWSLDHAPLTPHAAISLFLPLTLLAGATAANAVVRARRAAFVAGVVVSVAAALVVALDRSALPVAAIVMIPVVCGCARALTTSWRRLVVVAVAGLIAFAGVVFRGSRVDVTEQLAQALGVANRDAYGFAWVSLENTDRELVRFVATRTSVREAILAPDDLSGLLAAFTGRTVALLPGTTSRAASEKHVALTRGFYHGEEQFYESCRQAGVDYVVYSIDVLLDATRYSPRYLAGVPSVDSTSVAYRMHFDHESIRHFTLLYENDHYRLFKVTDGPEPIFLTDHPLYFDRTLLARMDGDLEAFRARVVEILLTYTTATQARVRGDAEGAGRRFEWCLQQAPRFSRARLGLADVLIELDRFEDARAVVMELLRYAPDNPDGLYTAAYVHARLGQAETAKAYLSILLGSTRDVDLRERARALEVYIDQGSPAQAPPRG
jgi:hypothetical protein